MVWNEHLKREIPEGWNVENILNIATWIGGSQPPKREHISVDRPGYIRFIQNRDYSGDTHITYIPISGSNKICDEFDIMIDKYGDAGKTRFGIAGAYNVALSRIEVLLTNGQEYIRQFLGSSGVKQYFSSSSMASTRASLNESNLAFLYLAIPGSALLAKFETQAKSIIKLVIENRKENQRLGKLRDWLLPMLMNGQVTVSSESTKLSFSGLMAFLRTVMQKTVY